MMGYSTQIKGYKIWDVESSTLVVSRDVVFKESSVNSLGIDIQSNEATDSNVADTGGECVENVYSNIKLPSDSSKES